MMRIYDLIAKKRDGRRHEVHEARADFAAVPLNEQVNAAHAVEVGERILQ